MPTTSRIAKTGDYRIDALLAGVKWGGPAGTGADLTYSFRGGYLSAEQQGYVGQALNAWAEVANLSFTQVSDPGIIRVGIGGYAQGSVKGTGYYPSSSSSGGDIWINPGIWDDIPKPGSAYYWVFLHEIGHAVGLSHAGDGTYGGMDELLGAENSHQYAVMAYNGSGGVYSDPESPMLYDILAIQHLYGANYATRAGDTTYSFPATDDTFMTIWDGGGTDTIDLSNQTRPATISLVPGTFSCIGPRFPLSMIDYGNATDNVAIAFGVTIENAIGGGGDDRITGNGVANVLKGGVGDDTLTGGAGDDVIEGGAGDDEAWFSNDLADYAISLVPGSTNALRVTAGSQSSDGADIVRNVETFQFRDGARTWNEMVALAGSGSPTNTDPQAHDDTGTIAEDGTATAGNVLANDTDEDSSDTLCVSSITGGSVGAALAGGCGSVTVNADGSYSYTIDNANPAVQALAVGGTLDDVFTYTVDDSHGGTDTATLTITVTGANDTPVAEADAIVVAAGETVVLDVLANDHDADGETLEIVGFSAPSHGTVTHNSPLSYQADADFTGTDQFTYTIRDGNGGTATATVEVTVIPAGIIQLSEDAITSYDNQDKGVTGFEVSDGGSTLHLAGNAWKKMAFDYTVTADTVLEFEFRSGDEGELHGIGLDSDNDLYNGTPRYKFFQVYGTQSGTWFEAAETYDASGDWQTLRIDVGEHFTGAMTYLTFIADDDRQASAESDFRNVRIYEDVSSPPVAMNDAVTATEDTPAVLNIAADLLANDADPDNGPLAMQAFTQPTNGSLVDNGDGTLTYTPATGFSGLDGFSYTLTDGDGTDTATVDITVSPVNDAPLAMDDAATTATGQTVSIDVLANDTDPDGDGLALAGFTQPDHGTVVENGDGTLTYTPDTGFSGTDPFSYTVTDTYGAETSAAVAVTVIPAETIQFSESALTSYSNQDKVVTGFEVSDNGSALHLAGNAWKKMPFAHTVTADTVLEFEFRSGDEGELHGIGLDSDNDLYNGTPRYKFFQVYGTQSGTWFEAAETYDGGGDWQTFRIDVGEHFTGAMNYLTFFADDDRDASAESDFRNIRIYENAAPSPAAMIGTEDVTEFNATDLMFA